MSTPAAVPVPATLSTSGRCWIFVVAFLGWLCAGMHMSITQLTAQPAAIDLLSRTGELDGERFQALSKKAPTKADEQALSTEDRLELKQGAVRVGQWHAWFQCAFLFGAAAGGLCFGRLGDRIGRSKAMAACILTYSALAALTSLAQSPVQFWILWFLACMGVGGMWPNGVALVSEAWSSLSRPAVAGVIGTAANIGLFLLPTIASRSAVTPDSWRWLMLIGAAPLLLGIVSLLAVPESPRWLAAQNDSRSRPLVPSSIGEVFRPPLLRITLIAIVLGTVPMLGGWGTANWMIPWSIGAGKTTALMQTRALTGTIGSLLGGWIASQVGRRRTYFLASLASLAIAQYIFWFIVPSDDEFLIWVAALGFVSGIYFGWLPLCLPELFATRVRSTGAGVGFNFGRLATAVTIFAFGALMDFFDGDYARIGRVTSLLFILGMVAIWLTPDTSERQLDD